MKIFVVDFSPMWPVPCGLVIAAKDKKEARKIAKETISHTKEIYVKEVDTSESKVIFYESGDY